MIHSITLFMFAMFTITVANAGDEIIMRPGEKYKISVKVDHPENVRDSEFFIGNLQSGVGSVGGSNNANVGKNLKFNKITGLFEADFVVPAVFKQVCDHEAVDSHFVINMRDQVDHDVYACMNKPTDAKSFFQLNARVVDYKIDNTPPKWVSGRAIRLNETTLMVNADVIDDSTVSGYLMFDEMPDSDAVEDVKCIVDTVQPTLKHCYLTVQLPRVITSDHAPEGYVLLFDQVGNALVVAITADGKKRDFSSIAIACAWPHQSVPKTETGVTVQSKEKFTVSNFQIEGSNENHTATIRFTAQGLFEQPIIHIFSLDGKDITGAIVECSKRIDEAGSDCTAQFTLPEAVDKKLNTLNVIIASDLELTNLEDEETPEGVDVFVKELTVAEFPVMSEIPVVLTELKILDVKLEKIQ